MYVARSSFGVMCHSFRLQRVLWTGHLTMQNIREQSSELLWVIFHNPPPYWVSTEAPPSTIGLWSSYIPFTALEQAARYHNPTAVHTTPCRPSYPFSQKKFWFQALFDRFSHIKAPKTFIGLHCHKQSLLQWFIIQLATCNNNIKSSRTLKIKTANCFTHINIRPCHGLGSWSMPSQGKCPGLHSSANIRGASRK